jgi:anionic cell wall polymer biosynthesis LytR-Cps2A-Psr (LCP) family protein
MDRRKVVIKRVLILLSVLVLAVLAGATAFLSRILHPRNGEQTGAGPTSVADTIKDITDLVGNPYAGFPHENRVVILCMGIDDNWTDSDEVYTVGARTDTLFFLTLDLKHRKATMLSIPRDTYTHIIWV